MLAKSKCNEVWLDASERRRVRDLNTLSVTLLVLVFVLAHSAQARLTNTGDDLVTISYGPRMHFLRADNHTLLLVTRTWGSGGTTNSWSDADNWSGDTLPAFGGASGNAAPLADIACPASQKIWDGGGATNSWFEGANWCNNTVPGVNQTVTFDGTSVKDAIIDSNTSPATGARAVIITSAYSGTITVADGISAFFDGTSSS